MRTRLITALAVGVALAGAVASVPPLYGGRTWDSYAERRTVISAGMLVPGAYTSIPSPYALHLLAAESVDVPLGGGQGFEFYPPRPATWEIVNPIATPGIDKGDPAYWAIALGAIDQPLLDNFDVLLLPIAYTGAPVNLTIPQQRTLQRWVDGGGLLWIDNQPGPGEGEDPQLGDFFLRPRVQFAARDRALPAPKVAVDRNHPLLRGRYVLTADEIQWLGQQFPYSTASAGLSPLDGILGGVNNPFWPNSGIEGITLPQEVVGQYYEVGGVRQRAPVIAACRYGDGAIVITACGVAAGISDWYAALGAGTPQTAAELPQWALPDMKLAYNMFQWRMEWSATQGGGRFRGEYAEAVPGPLVLEWLDAMAGAVSGPAGVGRGLALAGSSDGRLGMWDTRPYRDRALNLQSDDGAPDYGLGAAADLLWNVIVPWQDPEDENPRDDPPARRVMGSPAVTTIYDGNRARQVAAVAVRTADNLDCSLHAYEADATDAAALLADPDYPEVAPAWSATLRRYDRPNPEDNSGLVATGPVAVDGFFAILTTDSGTLEAPNRDAHLNLYDAAGPALVSGTYYEQPAASLELTRGGRAMSFHNPAAMAMTIARDAVTGRTEPVRTAVMVGNSLPRPAPSAVGWLQATPLMVRAPAPGWNQTWLLNPAAGDYADDANTQAVDENNQAVVVLFRNLHPANPEAFPVGDPRRGWIQVPPHVDNDPNQPLNYVRSVIGGQIAITFTDWSLFAWGPASENRYPLGFNEIWIRYRDTQNNWRDLNNLALTPATPVVLNAMLPGAGARTASISGFVSETGFAAPCVVGDDIYVGTDSVNAFPSPSSEGQVAAYSAGRDLKWRFIGDRYRGQSPQATGGYYLSSYSYTPAFSDDTLFAVGNYRYFMATGDQRPQVPEGGVSGALYALEVKAAPTLFRWDGLQREPVFDPRIDPVAPRNDGVNPPPYSADPNQTVPPGRTGAAVWITTNTNPASPDYNSPRYSVPAVSGAQSNWRLDAQNSIIRLDVGAHGELACPVWDDTADGYLPRQVRVRYFSGGVLQEQIMEVAPMVKWLYLAPAGVEFVSSPLVVGDRVLVVAHDSGGERYLLLSFRATPEQTADDLTPLYALPVEPEYAQVLAAGVPIARPCSLAVSDGAIVWSATGADGVGIIAGLTSPQTVVADNDRLVALDPNAAALTTYNAAWHMRADDAIGAAGIPLSDSYAEREFLPLDAPRRVRTLPDGNLLVVLTGTSAVVELDAAGQVVWRYPNDDPVWDLEGMSVREARLLSPTDAQRHYYLELVPGDAFVDPEGIIRDGDMVEVLWVSTLIADSGNSRVLEVVRPLLDGRYRPTVTDDATGVPYAETVRRLAAPELTEWPTAVGGVTRLRADFTTVERLDAASPDYPFMSTTILCGVGNHPDARAARLVGEDRYVGLVEIQVAYEPYAPGQPLAQVASSAVVPRGGEGINALRPRVRPWTLGEESPRDFLGVRQADRVVANAAEHLLVVDDVGVKLIPLATWDATLTPAFEMRGAAPWLHDPGLARPSGVTTYEEEIAGVAYALGQWELSYGDPTTTGIYPPLIREPQVGLTQGQWLARQAGAWANIVEYTQAILGAGARQQVPFLPAFARRLPDGRFLIVNTYPGPYASTDPLEVMAPTTSEVIEIDPRQGIGERLLRIEEATNRWTYFIAPDPAAYEYPRLRGGASPLRQPLAVDQR